MPSEVVDAPSLEAFQARLNGAQINLIQLKMSLLAVGRLGWVASDGSGSIPTRSVLRIRWLCACPGDQAGTRWAVEGRCQWCSRSAKERSVRTWQRVLPAHPRCHVADLATCWGSWQGVAGGTLLRSQISCVFSSSGALTSSVG